MVVVSVANGWAGRTTFSGVSTCISDGPSVFVSAATSTSDDGAAGAAVLLACSIISTVMDFTISVADSSTAAAWACFDSSIVDSTADFILAMVAEFSIDSTESVSCTTVKF